MDIEVIERKIALGYSIPVIEGRGGNHIVEIDGKRVFYKPYKEVRKINPLTHPGVFLHMYCKYNMPSTEYLDYKAPINKKMEKEVSTIIKWREVGIPTPTILAIGRNAICYEYLEGNSLGNEFNGSLRQDLFASLLDSYTDIRRAAKKQLNPEILHPDPYANNFFHDKKRDILVPLDPGKTIRSMSFDEADARINLFFMLKIFHLATSSQNQLSYLEQTVDSFTKSEKERIVEINAHPWVKGAYFTSQQWLSEHGLDKYRGADKLSVYYSRETINAVQKALTRRL